MVESSEATSTHVFGNYYSHRSGYSNSYANADTTPYEICGGTVKSKESLYNHQLVVSTLLSLVWSLTHFAKFLVRVLLLQRMCERVLVHVFDFGLHMVQLQYITLTHRHPIQQ